MARAIKAAFGHQPLKIPQDEQGFSNSNLLKTNKASPTWKKMQSKGKGTGQLVNLQ
jgi:hypothetical protein